ncbi:hypothetical protein BD560DRAFT_446942 [Blakeslea trispora]|nr:hypothetical protein BD560DRAFT_446942 [Blakeslea trispora]
MSALAQMCYKNASIDSLKESHQVSHLFGESNRYQKMMEGDKEINPETWNSLPVKGAFYMLVKNEQLQHVRATIRSIEDRLVQHQASENGTSSYPWILLNHQRFTPDFIKYVRMIVKDPHRIYFGHIDPEVWNYPIWINSERAEYTALKLVAAGTKDAFSQHNRKRMRYQAGLFHYHSLFDQVDYVWRMEPGTTYTCDMLPFVNDPFVTMHSEGRKLGKWTDGMVKSIAAAMFLHPSQVKFFNDIGMEYGSNMTSEQDSALSFEARLDLSDNASLSGRFNRKQNTTSVHQLLLRRNELDSLDIYAKALSQFKQHLTELSLRENQFKEFPSQVLMFESLVSLSLAQNVLQHIETGILSQLAHLQWLNLGHNRLTTLPADLFQCRELRGLNLENNQFKTFPFVLCYLPRLEILMLQKNKIECIPPNCHFPSTLLTLNLSFNMLTCVPDTLVHHPPRYLTHLHLSGNSLQTLPPLFLSVGYAHLVSLDLHTCHLTQLSDIFFQRLAECAQFKRLNLAINKLKELPPSIGKITNLQWLNLNDNQLYQLPPTMANLTQLVKLGLVQNQIQTLPPFLFLHMLQLEKLDVRRNRLKYLPSSLLALAPKEELAGHLDLHVPHSVFYMRRHVQGGSLKTLLVYENPEIESLDGLLTEIDMNRQIRTIQLACLNKAYETSILAKSPKESVQLLLQARKTSDSSLSKSDHQGNEEEVLIRQLRRILPLKEIMLQQYLTKMNHQDTDCFVRQAFAEYRVPFLIRSFAENYAQQCDYCDGWYTSSSVQVGFLTRLCRYRLQVPIRFQICSLTCATEAIAQLQKTSLDWEMKKKPDLIDTTSLASSNNTRSFRDRMTLMASSILNTRQAPPPPILSNHQREPPAIMSLASRIVECILQIDDPPTSLPLSTPTPNPTGFNHLPRDAIRLERF